MGFGSDAFEGVFTQRLRRGLVRRLNNRSIAAAARRVARGAPPAEGRPVAFFKASTGIDDLSWNSAFHLLASWGLRLQGVPIAYFACEAGMSRCVLGTNRDDPSKLPPCKSCVYQMRTLYTDVADVRKAESREARSAASVRWFGFERDAALAGTLEGLSLEALTRVEWPKDQPLPLGQLCLPGLRWILRRHNLDDNHNTRFLMIEYILSAWNIAREFARFLDEENPRAVVVFNGQFFPEAVARFVSQRRGLRVITHEVGLQPASAFFTDGEATAYPIHIPGAFDLNETQNARLDTYLAQRFHGDFTMAGIQFWPNMRGLDDAFLTKAAGFLQIAAVFTNVIFDTSQPHANTVFADMFAWLAVVLDAIRTHPETLFVIRAHPDETRTRKESRETVQRWVEENGLDEAPNVVFVAPREYLSSYELIQRSKFVTVYNSTIGLEAAIMGKPVLCGGRARFTQYPTVFFPQSAREHKDKLEEFLRAGTIAVPEDFRRNARRFLYYQLFKTALPFGDFLAPSVRKTQATLRPFALDALKNSPAVRAISGGILNGQDFLLDD